MSTKKSKAKIKELTIHVDGGARGNPGPAAVGIYIEDGQGNFFKEYKKYLGEETNNVAEYQAAILALQKVKRVFGKKKCKEMTIQIFSDSELLVKHLSHQYKIKNKNLQKLFLQLWNLMLDFKEVKIKGVAREENQEADRLVNEALDEEERETTLFD